MTQVTVPANQPNGWYPTPFQIQSGNILKITPTSDPANNPQPWPLGPRIDPDGNRSDGIPAAPWSQAIYPSAMFGALIGRIGPAPAPAFSVGNTYGQQTAQTSGTLYLAFNDGVNFNDNTGYWSVDVVVTSVPTSCAAMDAVTQSAWDAAVAIVNTYTTSNTAHLPSGYMLPTGHQVVVAMSKYSVCPVANAPAGLTAAYDPIANVVEIQKGQTPLDPAAVIHELTHAYLANTCPSIFGGSNAPSLMNEMLAFRSEGAIRYDFPPLANVNPFSQADLQNVHDHIATYFPNITPGGASLYYSLPLYPSTYNADHAAYGLPNLI